MPTRTPPSTHSQARPSSKIGVAPKHRRSDTVVTQHEVQIETQIEALDRLAEALGKLTVLSLRQGDTLSRNAPSLAPRSLSEAYHAADTLTIAVAEIASSQVSSRSASKVHEKVHEADTATIPAHQERLGSIGVLPQNVGEPLRRLATQLRGNQGTEFHTRVGDAAQTLLQAADIEANVEALLANNDRNIQARSATLLLQALTHALSVFRDGALPYFSELDRFYGTFSEKEAALMAGELPTLKAPARTVRPWIENDPRTPKSHTDKLDHTITWLTSLMLDLQPEGGSTVVTLPSSPHSFFIRNAIGPSSNSQGRLATALVGALKTLNQLRPPVVNIWADEVTLDKTRQDAVDWVHQELGEVFADFDLGSKKLQVERMKGKTSPESIDKFSRQRTSETRAKLLDVLGDPASATFFGKQLQREIGRLLATPEQPFHPVPIGSASMGLR